MSARVAVQTERQLLGGLLDAYTATRRFLIRGKRQPDVIFGSVLIPVIFVVLFGYVFGSSIRRPGWRQLPLLPDAGPLRHVRPLQRRTTSRSPSPRT